MISIGNIYRDNKMKILKLGILLVLWTLSSCAVLDHASGAKPLERDAKWVLLPIVNNTDVPQAGLRAETITEVLLRARGINNLRRYPPALNQDSLFEPAERKVVNDALNWAREQGVRYAVTGAVDEWHYKVGVDGEPAVGMTLQIIDLKDGDRVVWSAAGSKSGWSRDALSAVAQKLIKDMLSDALSSDHQVNLRRPYEQILCAFAPCVGPGAHQPHDVAGNRGDLAAAPSPQAYFFEHNESVSDRRRIPVDMACARVDRAALRRGPGFCFVAHPDRRLEADGSFGRYP